MTVPVNQTLNAVPMIQGGQYLSRLPINGQGMQDVGHNSLRIVAKIGSNHHSSHLPVVSVRSSGTGHQTVKPSHYD